MAPLPPITKSPRLRRGLFERVANRSGDRHAGVLGTADLVLGEPQDVGGTSAEVLAGTQREVVLPALETARVPLLARAAGGGLLADGIGVGRRREALDRR